MNCSKALKVISLVIDGEATEFQRTLLDFHLLGCSSCRKAIRMSRDISRIAGNLPSPMLPVNLENNVREMLRTRADIKHSEHRFHGTYLTIPAAAALLIFTFTVLPHSTGPESITEPQSICMTEFESKNSDMQVSLKSGIRTAPLSGYSRQASLISF